MRAACVAVAACCALACQEAVVGGYAAANSGIAGTASSPARDAAQPERLEPARTADAARPDAGKEPSNDADVRDAGRLDASTGPDSDAGADEDAGSDPGTPNPCAAGSCNHGGPSCASLRGGCGPNADENCCGARLVPGGSFLRLNDTRFPATVSAFYLDEFEVTVDRFRAFIAAYPDSSPEPGDGAHPRIPGSGWDPAQNEHLEGSLGNLFNAGPLAAGHDDATWGPSDSFVIGTGTLPANRLSWWMAFAFCAWDGGRLPTEAEWNYAAAGGDEQRVYPWGDQQPTAATGGVACTSEVDCIKSVGLFPAGAGRWGQRDLAGNVMEWTLDYFAYDPPVPCTDCARLEPFYLPLPGRPVAAGRVMRGGSFRCVEAGSDCTTAFRNHADTYAISHGFRCARDDE